VGRGSALAIYLDRHDKLVDEKLAANPIPERAPWKRRRSAKVKYSCFLKRFRDVKDDILRSSKDGWVPYTINTAERVIIRGEQLRNYRIIRRCIRRCIFDAKIECVFKFAKMRFRRLEQHFCVEFPRLGSILRAPYASFNWFTASKPAKWHARPT